MMKVVPQRRRVQVVRSNSVERKTRDRVLRHTRRRPQEAEAMITSRIDEEDRARARAASEVSPVLQEGEALSLLG